MYDALTLLPPGMLVEFKNSFDKVARESYYEMSLIPPFPPESCMYGSLTNACVGEEGNRRPNPDQDTLQMEFDLFFTKVDVVYRFANRGATAKSVVYQVRGYGHTWEGWYFVSKGGQTMWGRVTLGATYTVDPDGSQHDSTLEYTAVQVYHRVPTQKLPVP